MRTILAFIMRSRVHAMGASAVCAALSLVAPPLSYVSGAIIGLATLRNGTAEGGIVILGSLVMAGAFIAIQIGTPLPILVFATVTWLPVWVLATLIRRTAGIGTALAGAGLGGAFVVVGLHLALGDPGAWWRETLGALYRQMLGGGETGLDAGTLARLDAWLDALSPVMTGLVAAGFVVGVVLTLFLARWWHAALDNAGGFAREFRGLRLPPPVALVSLGLALLAAIFGGWLGGVARDMLWPVVVLYMFQGIALVHGIVAGRGASIGWLVALYSVLFIVREPAVLMLAMAGFLDTWLNFRDRYRGKSS